MTFLAPTHLANAITFTIPGILPGWQRAGKSGKRHFTQARTANAQAEIAAWAWQAAAGRRLQGALGLLMVVGEPIPRSWPSSRRISALSGILRPASKGHGDWDNRGKNVSDALNGVLWDDDGQVADGRVVRFYVEQPRTVVRVWELAPESPEKFFGVG